MADTQPNNEFDAALLSAYVDNELTLDERALVDDRLRTDEGARQTLAALQAASEAVKSLPRIGLGRDLRDSVLAEIARQHPADAPASILTLPDRGDDERETGGARGLIWAAMAVAAAMLLMVLLPGDEARKDRSVAQSSGEKRIEAADGEGERSAAAAPSDDATAGTGIADRGGTFKSAAAPATASDDVRRAQPPGSPRNAATGTSSPATRNVPLGQAPPTSRTADVESELSQAADAASGAEAQTASDAAPAAAAELDPETPTFDLVLSDDSAVADFQRTLAEQGIELIVADEDLAATLPQAARQRGAGAASRDQAQTDQPTPGEPFELVLVEATAEQLDGLIIALQRKRELLREERAVAAPGAAAPAEATGGGIGGGGFGGAGSGAMGGGGFTPRTLDESRARGRAWRLTLRSDSRSGSRYAEADALSQSRLALEGAAEPSRAEGRSDERGGRQADLAPANELVRALFVLRRDAGSTATMPAGGAAATGSER